MINDDFGKADKFTMTSNLLLYENLHRLASGDWSNSTALEEAQMHKHYIIIIIVIIATVIIISRFNLMALSQI